MTSRHVWSTTAIFAVLGLILLVPLLYIFRDDAFQCAARGVGVASALFWGVVAVVAVFGFWILYYQYLYTAWIRWLSPPDVLLNGAIGLGLWWLARRLPGPDVLWFVVLGGVEGIAEHVFGIYGLCILEKVPWLQGLAPLPVLIFSFSEYVLYWTLVTWLAVGLNKLVT